MRPTRYFFIIQLSNAREFWPFNVSLAGNLHLAIICRFVYNVTGILITCNILSRWWVNEKAFTQI